MSTAHEILDLMPERDRNAVLEFLGVLAEPLTRKVLAFLAAGQTEIHANDIPTDLIGSTDAQVLARLSRLKGIGLVKSDRVAANGMFHLRYKITDAGKVWVDRMRLRPLCR